MGDGRKAASTLSGIRRWQRRLDLCSPCGNRQRYESRLGRHVYLASGEAGVTTVIKQTVEWLWSNAPSVSQLS